jgi:hypothetical protein
MRSGAPRNLSIPLYAYAANLASNRVACKPATYPRARISFSAAYASLCRLVTAMIAEVARRRHHPGSPAPVPV